MRASEIMETEISPRREARLNDAIESFKNGFETEAARKEAMSAPSNAYEDLRRAVADKISKEFWEVADENRNPVPGHEKEYERLNKLKEVAYDLPFNLSQIREKHFPFLEELGILPIMKKLLKLRQEFKDAPFDPKKRDLEKAAKKASAEASVIAEATAPLKQEALKRTEEEAKNYLKNIKKRLEEYNFNPYEMVPEPQYPTSKISYEYEEYRKKVKIAKAMREPLLNLVKRAGRDFEWDESGAERYIAACLRSTENHYDSFVAKMNEKVPTAVEASFKWVTDVWGSSVLSIKLADGSSEVWKTQMIINCSKLGKLFNQWPTRRVK